MKLLTSNWMILIISAIVYMGATVAFLKIPAINAGAASGPVPGYAILPPVPSWEFSNPEADQLIAELKSEKKNLSMKEQQISELTQRLQTERSELMQATQMVHQLQQDFDNNAIRVKMEEAVNLLLGH